MLVMILGFAACAAAFLYGLYLAIFRKGRRKLGVMTALSAPIAFGLIGLLGASIDARQNGWESLGQESEAKAAGISDPAAWREKEAATAMAEADRAAAELAENTRKGFHCLSAWDGSHSGTVETVKASLREPDSFEHIETKITPVSADGTHILMMSYRARNGFGGMNVAQAIAEIDNTTCQETIKSIE
jgi:hypothetical protein